MDFVCVKPALCMFSYERPLVALDDSSGHLIIKLQQKVPWMDWLVDGRDLFLRIFGVQIHF